MAYQIIGVALVAALYVLVRFLNATENPKIKGIPEIPGVPIFGNLIELGTNHARVAQRWAKKYGPVFQARLGNRRVVFANSYETVRHFWITHQSSLISRPMFHTFHSVVSSSQGFTIGTSPWDESCRRRRKAAGTALNRPATQSYMPIIDLESTESIKDLLEDCKGGTKSLDPNAYMQRLSLNTSLTLTYGFRIDGSIESELLKEVAHVEREISNLRSTSNNWQDYVPLLRLWGRQNSTAKEYRARRDKYLSYMLDRLKSDIEKGTDRPCITGNILKDPEAKLNAAEIQSICLTMVSAGLDTVPGNIIMTMAYLSTEEGQVMQAKLLKAIEDVYPNGDAWEKCLVEEKVPYLTAFIKETLRFWTVLPIGLPRTNIRDIPYKDTVIPAGTTFLMNAYAADYDEERFKMPKKFMPERYLDGRDTGTPHYGFGAGSRMCVGFHLANRQMYTTFIRLITAFEMFPSDDGCDAPCMDCLDSNATPTSLTLDPKPFRIGLRPRSEENVRRWIAEAEERTAHLRW
ncbi:hypothetical protein E4U42_001363 [Claviceps africana]|uniref:Phenylacetate 2-hydroxylase n=1 Tax=Claviceps africana TaxID=83212 RepID=A0A8K0JF49_9HYPO|nr:hypothetical protein E4U42_001363 [Claviceps africana]